MIIRRKDVSVRCEKGNVIGGTAVAGGEGIEFGKRICSLR